MITYVQGDLFTSPAEVLVNTVNTVGVMGKGIAKEFKRYYPEMFKLYQEMCESGIFDIGQLFYYPGLGKSVLNFPTKKSWRSPSRVEYIEKGLRKFVDEYERLGITSVAFPQLGCGNGELDWGSQVKPLMEAYLDPLPIRVYIHLSGQTESMPEHRDPKWMKKWLHSEPRSLPFAEVWDDIRAVVAGSFTSGEWRITLVDVETSFFDPLDDHLEAPSQGLQFANSVWTIVLDAEELRSIWAQFRSTGLLSVEDIPEPCSKVAVPLFSILSHLDYVTSSSFSRKDRKSDGESATNLRPGLKLVPDPVEERQMELRLLSA